MSVSILIILAMVLAAMVGFLLPANDAPLIVSLLVGSIWLAGLVVAAVSGTEGWRTAWIVGCVVGVAAATTSMASSVLMFLTGAVISVIATTVGIWTVNHQMPRTSTDDLSSRSLT